MNMLSPVLLGLSLAVAGGTVAAAQQESQSADAVPKVLQVVREYLKPGKAGPAHDKTESAFVQAMARAKAPAHYIALSSLSGKLRSVYLTGFPSFQAWEDDYKAVMKNPTLSAELDRAAAADGELLDSMDEMVLSYDPDLSYRPIGDLAHARIMEVAGYHVRPGHGKDWRDLVKLVIDAHKKAETSAHWAMFHVEYGGEGGTYILLSSDKSMGEIDTAFTEDQKFRDALGEDGMKKLSDLFAASVDKSDQELFAINPRQSYVSSEWIQEDPDFWKPKPVAKPAPAQKKSTP